MAEIPTLDEYRNLIAKARALVVAWRDAVPPSDYPDYSTAWFDRWRDDSVEAYNGLSPALSKASSNGVLGALSRIRGSNRAMLENMTWSRIAPEAEKPFGVFADTFNELWVKLPESTDPQAVEVAPLLRALADEFEPVTPRHR